MPNDPVLHLLGLAKKAGKLEIGEEPVGSVCRARRARLLLLAGNSAPNTFRRAAHFGQAGNVICLPLPHTKEELGLLFGRKSCAMAAVTDFGLAAAVAGRLEAMDPERYGPAARQLRERADRAMERREEKRRHEKNMQKGGKKPWAPPPGKMTAQTEKTAREGKRPRKAQRPPSGPAGERGTAARPRGFSQVPGPGGRRPSAARKRKP